MDQSKVLVFDDFHYFSRFLKYEFKDIKFITGNKKAIIYGNEINTELSLIVFVFYSEDDLIDLLRLYAHGIQLLICNHCPKFVNKFGNIKNIGVLNCLETKRGYRHDLRVYFDETFNLVN